MTDFRRIIAIFILALFTCQSIMAGVDEHVDHPSDANIVGGLHLEHADSDPASHPDPDQPFTPQLMDGDCCHSHGHCHLLAFAGQISNDSISLSHNLAAPHDDAYISLSPNTLLRPPTHA
jgi:hypothetical protein